VPFISRKSFIALLAIGLFQVKMPSSGAAIGPTLKPTRLGQSIIWRGKKYTAIRSGKKLVWNKGVVVPVKKAKPTSTPKPAIPKASASPTPSPTETPSPTATPTETPTPEAKPVGLYEVDIGASTEVPNGETRLFYPGDPRLNGKGFLITREKGALIAFDNNCTHAICPVEIATPHLVCYCHDSFFDRITGDAVSGPASQRLIEHKVREVAGRILVTNSY